MIHAALSKNDISRPTLDESREQIERIRRSADFDATEREHQFLAYVAEETFAGRADRIKAYSIAMEVFGRGSAFDPQNDPIVRITANHLRRSLERYYLLSGRSDQVLVSIPKGCYVPTFAFRGGRREKHGDVGRHAPPAATFAQENPPPGTEDIRLQLERIVLSPEFPKVGRSAAFLRYVVEEVIAAREDRIKGYSIAIEVFKRPVSFTQDDPVVRIEAGRLRRALERYYLVAGHADPVRIDIPKGGYVPTFTWNTGALPEPENGNDASTTPGNSNFGRARLKHLGAGAALTFVGLLAYGWWAGVSNTSQTPFAVDSGPERPSLIVAPFENLGEGSRTDIYARGITEDLMTALVRFREIKVFGRETSQSLSPAVEPGEIKKRLGADYLLSGGVRSSDKRLRVTAQLTSTLNGEILWSQTYDKDLGAADLIALQSDVADKVATTVAQPNGIISRIGPTEDTPSDIKTYECTLLFYTYRAELAADMHAQVRDCLEDVITRYPAYAAGWAMLSITYLDEARFRFNERRSIDPLPRALQVARHAIELDATNVRGLQALMMALVYNQQYPEAMRVGELALAANPNDAELLGEFGTRVALAGDWQRGAILLDRAIALNPGRGGYYYGTRALVAFFLNDNQAALAAIQQAELDKFPLFHAVAAIIYADANLPAEARDEGRAFMRMYPAFTSNLAAELQMRFHRPQDQLRVAEGLRKAGLPVKPAFEAALRAEAQYDPP